MPNVWKRAWRSLFVVVLLAAALYVLLFIAQGGITSSSAQINLLIDLLLFGLGFLFWLLVFAHFIVPLQRPAQVLDMAAEMLRSLLGLAPSAASIKNGEPISGISNQQARLLLLDSASAAVLHTGSAYTRAVGPGVSIGRVGERIAGTLDLRVQRRSLGPRPDEDPFAPHGLDENDASYQARLHRRSQTSALTHDDVEIAARIEVELRLISREAQLGLGIGFQPDSAWRAIAHEGVAIQAPSDARERQLSWDWLPAHLAADLWREHLRKFPLGSLFEEKQTNLTTLEFVEQCLNLRLQEAIVPELDNRGNSTGRKYSSPEYQLLRSRGLCVLGVNIREIHLEREQAEAQLLSSWTANWEQRGKQLQIEASETWSSQALLARKNAEIDFVHRASRALYLRLLKTDGREVSPPDEKETLELLLSGAIQTIGANQKLRQFASQLKGNTDGAG